MNQDIPLFFLIWYGIDGMSALFALSMLIFAGTFWWIVESKTKKRNKDQ